MRRAKHQPHLAGARGSGQQHKEQQQCGNDLVSSGVHDAQPLHGEGDVGQSVTRREQRAKDVRTGQLDLDLGVGGKAQHGHSKTETAQQNVYLEPEVRAAVMQ